MRIIRAIGIFLRRADMLLLALCVAASLFGALMVSSATAHFAASRYVTVQLAAIAIGVALYVLLSLFDVEILAGQSRLLLLFNVLFLSTLFFWGVAGNTGNRSWLEFSWLPFNIQPAEFCKITFIIINAKIMRDRRNHISDRRSIAILLAHLLLTVGLILLASSDTGVALIYVFVFFLMCFAGGVSRYWFLGGLGALAVAGPVFWFFLLRQDQKNRVMALFDPSIDPAGDSVLWQTNLSLRAIRGGGVTGQGLYHGALTQAGVNPQQHNDFIFSAVVEELGVVGGIVLLLLLLAIVARCIYVGVKSENYLNRLICIGIAGMLLFQIAVNVGMCLGIMPVVGLTLPFISYGGSSIVATFFAVGLVSGIRMHPSADSAVRYIRPRL